MVKYIVFVCLFFNLISLGATEFLTDPTKPLDYKTKVVKKTYRQALPKLQSILQKADKNQAIINNKLYKVGQKVSGYKITRINNDNVLLRYKGKTYKLSLYSSKERFTK